MDSAALEKLHTRRDQCRGSRAMAEVPAFGKSQLRQNQKPHERCLLVKGPIPHSSASNPLVSFWQQFGSKLLPSNMVLTLYAGHKLL
jgi:hypothetical protein